MLVLQPCLGAHSPKPSLRQLGFGKTFERGAVHDKCMTRDASCLGALTLEELSRGGEQLRLSCEVLGQRVGILPAARLLLHGLIGDHAVCEDGPGHLDAR